MALREELEAALGARGLGGSLRPPEAWGLAAAEAGEGPRAGSILEAVPATPGAGGVTSLAFQLAATAERLVWVDPSDRFDPASARRAGLNLERVLWLRGGGKRRGLTGLPGLARWHAALNAVVQSAALPLVVADFLSWPLAELRRTPRSAWFRLLRGLERTRRTGLLLLAPEPLAQTCAARVLRVRYEAGRWPAVSIEAQAAERGIASGAPRPVRKEDPSRHGELRA